MEAAFDGVFLLFGNVRLLLFPGVFETLADIDPLRDLLKDLLNDWPKMDWFKNELDELPLEILVTLVTPLISSQKKKYELLLSRSLLGFAPPPNGFIHRKGVERAEHVVQSSRHAGRIHSTQHVFKSGKRDVP